MNIHAKPTSRGFSMRLSLSITTGGNDANRGTSRRVFMIFCDRQPMIENYCLSFCAESVTA
jgi:hypothetical protein